MATNINSISAVFDAQLNAILLKWADATANDARAAAPTKRIAANVRVTPVTDTPEGKQITVYVSAKPDAAPEAPAYEFGSGLHDPEGPHTIDIDARNVPNLHFYWQKQKRWFLGPHVNHPGVEARPYLFPAGRKNFQAALTALKGTVKAVLVEATR